MIIFIASISYFSYVNKKDNSKVLASTKNELLINIDQTELNQKISNKEQFFVYIGRDTCPDCRAFMPKLKDILSNDNKSIFYYNTEVPASKKQEIRDYLQKFNVKSIPAILFINDGKVIDLYDCQDEKQINNFIKNFEGE